MTASVNPVSRKNSDNFRYFRRYLQGRGVNLRETIVSSVTPYSPSTRIVVPGLHDDDRIISVLDMTNLVDVTGDVSDSGTKATLAVFTTNKGIVLTALVVGAEGNLIDLEAIANPAGASSPLAVVIGDRDTIKGTTGHPGRTLIQVQLATDSSNVVLTTSANSAAAVQVAIEDVQESPIGDRIVDVDLAGTGATAWTTQALVSMSGGTTFGQGARFAQLVTNLSPYLAADVKYVAKTAGAAGNSISVAYTAGGSFSVGVSGSAITVTYVVGVTTAQNVIDGVNASAAASALVKAMAPNSAPPSDTSGVIETMTTTDLAGGQDPGFELSVYSQADKLKVLWLTRNEDTV